MSKTRFFFLNDPITLWKDCLLFLTDLESDNRKKKEFNYKILSKRKSRLRCKKVEKCKVYTLIVQTYKPEISKHRLQIFPPTCSTTTDSKFWAKSPVVILHISHSAQPTEQEISITLRYIKTVIFALLPCYNPSSSHHTLLPRLIK